MSEPSSVYAKIHISKANLKNYLNAQIKPLNDFNNWLMWINKQEYSGKITIEDVKSQHFWHCKTNQEYFDIYLSEDFTSSYFDYDERQELLIISILQFSQNMFDYIKMIHIIGSISSFKSSENTDFLMIYDFLWFEDAKPTYYLEIKKDKSNIVYTIGNELIIEATNYLEKRREINCS